MAATTADLLAGLLELVRALAREGAAEALSQVIQPAPALAPLIDKQELARALRVSSATIDRMCANGRIPFVYVGDVRRFDLIAVRAALSSTAAREEREPKKKRATSQESGVRLLSRKIKV